MTPINRVLIVHNGEFLDRIKELLSDKLGLDDCKKIKTADESLIETYIRDSDRFDLLVTTENVDLKSLLHIFSIRPNKKPAHVIFLGETLTEGVDPKTIELVVDLSKWDPLY